MSGSASAVAHYQRVLDEFRRGQGDRHKLLKRLSELVSLLDLTSSYATARSGDEVLGGALLTAMGELRALRGAVLMRRDDGCLELRAVRGTKAAVPGRRFEPLPDGTELLSLAEAPGCEAMRVLGLELLCPIARAGRPVAYIGLGPRLDGCAYAPEELELVKAVASCAATPIENGLITEELSASNRRLQAKLFQLQNLFDLSRELTSSFDAAAIKNVVTATLMGHLLASRCAFYAAAEEGFQLVHERGGGLADAAPRLSASQAAAAFSGAPLALPVEELPGSSFKETLSAARFTHVVRLSSGGREQGFFVIGGRVPGAPLEEEDADFAMTLGRQALAALDAVRMHQVRLSKERQDRELQIARGIQKGLFPARLPALEGFELAARSESCYEIGGDYYDFISLGDGRLGLVVADVSGKGTPASLLMASVHASVQALAGGARPAALMERLNRFLFLNTQANKFVTAFYGELDPRARQLRYVNAGHVPPFVRRGDRLCRLEAGGPALGLLDGPSFEEAVVELGRGDVVAVVTDGATEAMSPQDEEFGDERVFEALGRAENAQAALERLFEAVHRWSGARGCSDDLTALVLLAG